MYICFINFGTVNVLQKKSKSLSRTVFQIHQHLLLLLWLWLITITITLPFILWLYGPLLAKWCFCFLNPLFRFVIALFLRFPRNLNFVAAVSVPSDFGGKENKICHCFHISPTICHEVIGPDAMILIFWMLYFRPAFSLSSFTLIKRLFISSSLSAIRVVSSSYLRLLIFLLGFLIPACDWFRLEFHMMYSAYNFKKQGDNIQLCHTPFLVLNLSIVPCVILTVAFWLTYRSLRRQARWSGTPICLRIFHSLLWSTQSKVLI